MSTFYLLIFKVQLLQQILIVLHYSDILFANWILLQIFFINLLLLLSNNLMNCRIDFLIGYIIGGRNIFISFNFVVFLKSSALVLILTRPLLKLLNIFVCFFNFILIIDPDRMLILIKQTLRIKYLCFRPYF